MSEREQMQYDILIVGAGPAGLSCAIRLKQLQPDLQVCVIEKAATIGGHILSGAVIETGPLDQLLPDWQENPPPNCVPASSDQMNFLTPSRAWKLPTPPQMHNQGNYVISLGSMVSWLGDHAESLGIELYPGFAAAQTILSEDQSVLGVQIGDMGLNKDGSPGAAYVQGVDILAKTTIFSEGCRGHLGKQLIEQFKLDENSDPQTYGIGLKELWQLPESRLPVGHVQHSIGWPLDSQTYGGSFMYQMDENRLAIGFVVGLDYQNPHLEPFEMFQQFKHHPSIRPLLEGGEILSSGARTLAEGGWQSMPNMELPGALLIGDEVGTLNVPKIKGTHTAMQHGILAAEYLDQNQTVVGFDAHIRQSKLAKELHSVRNIRPGFQKGLWFGLINAGLEILTQGKTPWTLSNHPDHEQLAKADQMAAEAFPERKLAPRDRLASVYFSATEHDENQPDHLIIKQTDICISECHETYQNPCTRFCPAQVYEWVESDQGPSIQINAANCVHCKTCDIKDPYQNIHWTTPEGASGPNYLNL